MASHHLFERIRRRTARTLKRVNPHHWLYRLRHTTWPFRDRYIIEDNTQVTVYTANPKQFPAYQPVRNLSRLPERRVAVSVILTARNEQATARQTIDSLLRQTRLPEEIVVTETGSSDGTLEVLRELAAESSVPIHIIIMEDANIARGRNAAIAQARGPVIAVTDFGCQPEPGWLEYLVAPFEIDPATQVSAGRYAEATPSRYSLWPALPQIDPQTYLPPGGAAAFTKTAWESVGGYPEWLTLTGEDTYFDLELKRVCNQWAFVPEAVIRWVAPDSRTGRLHKSYRWAVGDGEIGVLARLYQRLLLKAGFLFLGPVVLAVIILLGVLNGWTLLWLSGLLLACVWFGWLLLRLPRRGNLLASITYDAGLTAARLAGYLTGLRQQRLVDPRRWQGLRGVIVILSGVPIDDTGGGARGAQIAQELIRRQYLVIYANMFPKYETQGVDVRIGHPNLIATHFSQFSMGRLIHQFGYLLDEKPVGLLVEHPIPDFLPVIRELRKPGARVIYDVIDDWNTSLGVRWYTAEAEHELVTLSDALIATAPSLRARLEQLSAREVKLLPNAVNLRLFNAHRTYPRPADLPAAEWTVIYIGALWGEWFDWELLIETARHYPACSVVVIGDYREQCSQKLPNLHFLGLKPQHELPAYLAHSNVAIIPWKADEITLATSPLKVYEYLAMHKPVVAPDLPLLSDLPFVFRSQSKDGFLENIDTARHVQIDGEALESFLARNSWQERVDKIVEIISGDK
jgi:glycosyltransferase involved in cell wall biosynthesis